MTNSRYVAAQRIGTDQGHLVTAYSLLGSTARAGFNARAMSIMDEIEYRRVTTSEDLEPVRALREKSYIRGRVFSNPQSTYADETDLLPESYVFTVHYREELVSTLRIHILTAQQRFSNSNRFFPDVLGPLLDQGLTFMDPTRFAVDPDHDPALQGIPQITLRLGFLAAKHFRTDFCLSMLKDGHGGFYRRVFKSTQMTPYKKFPVFQAPYALFSSPKAMENVICTDYPMFRSLATERRLLFDEPTSGLPKVLSVRPTARAALRLATDLTATG